MWDMGGEARPRPDPDPGLWGQALGTEAPREAVGSGGLARARRAACGRHSQLGSFLLWERGRTALLSFFRTEVENVTPCRAPSGRAEVQRQVCCALCIPPCWEGTAAALWAAKARGRSPRNAAVLGWETHPQGCVLRAWTGDRPQPCRAHACGWRLNSGDTAIRGMQAGNGQEQPAPLGG